MALVKASSAAKLCFTYYQDIAKPLTHPSKMNKINLASKNKIVISNTLALVFKVKVKPAQTSL